MPAWAPRAPLSASEVMALEPGRSLGLRRLPDLHRRQIDTTGTWPRVYFDGLWGFLLEELPGGRTRPTVSAGFRCAQQDGR